MKPELSFEFFPPKTDVGTEKLLASAKALNHFKPTFFSVTYGAGGSTRETTLNAVLNLYELGYQVAPHISCIGSQKKELCELLHLYKDKGITRLVVLRGDRPSGMVGGGDFQYAFELIQLIREEFAEHFYIEVAAYPEYHPESKTPDADWQYFCEKVAAGANSAITQYFFNADAYETFMEKCQSHAINIPIFPGIMPITQFQRLAQFSEACGAEIPRWIRLKLAAYQDEPESLLRFGEEVVVRLCERLLSLGAPGLHFYTLNKHEPAEAICNNLLNTLSKD